MRLADEAPPAVDEQLGADRGVQVTRVLERVPGQLRKCLTFYVRAIDLHAEVISLAVGGVENVVGAEKEREAEIVCGSESSKGGRDAMYIELKQYTKGTPARFQKTSIHPHFS